MKILCITRKEHFMMVVMCRCEEMTLLIYYASMTKFHVFFCEKIPCISVVITNHHG